MSRIQGSVFKALACSAVGGASALKVVPNQEDTFAKKIVAWEQEIKKVTSEIIEKRMDQRRWRNKIHVLDYESYSKDLLTIEEIIAEKKKLRDDLKKVDQEIITTVRSRKQKAVDKIKEIAKKCIETDISAHKKIQEWWFEKHNEYKAEICKKQQIKKQGGTASEDEIYKAGEEIEELEWNDDRIFEILRGADEAYWPIVCRAERKKEKDAKDSGKSTGSAKSSKLKL